jgi:Zn-dependent oligopeptidase
VIFGKTDGIKSMSIRRTKAIFPETRVKEAFVAAPGGLYDPDIAKRYFNSILSVDNTVPADEAFRNLMGRDPDPGALMRRFE